MRSGGSSNWIRLSGPLILLIVSVLTAANMVMGMVFVLLPKLQPRPQPPVARASLDVGVTAVEPHVSLGEYLNRARLFVWVSERDLEVEGFFVYTTIEFSGHESTTYSIQTFLYDGRAPDRLNPPAWMDPGDGCGAGGVKIDPRYEVDPTKALTKEDPVYDNYIPAYERGHGVDLLVGNFATPSDTMVVPVWVQANPNATFVRIEVRELQGYKRVPGPPYLRTNGQPLVAFKDVALR